MSKPIKTKLQFSAGGVVYRKAGAETEVIVLTRGEGKIFCLPKGKIERLETPQQAALREIKEETGLTGSIEKELGKINYWFYSDEDKARVHKTVYFYLVRFESGNTADHDTDAEDVRWLPVEEALRIMTYPSERQMVEKAKNEDRL
ncbi:MAG: NUDIX hydrolase [Candidatus Omnitrophota bacterium]